MQLLDRLPVILRLGRGRIRDADPMAGITAPKTNSTKFALFMVEALENDELIHETPAIVGCQTASALAHAADK